MFYLADFTVTNRLYVGHKDLSLVNPAGYGLLRRLVWQHEKPLAATSAFPRESPAAI
jgi:hypothetical protein